MKDHQRRQRIFRAVASTIGLLAVLALMAVINPFSAAAAASCKPTANGQAGGSSSTAANGTQNCTGGDTGIAYQATGGDLTVNVNNGQLTPHGINVTDDGFARNITVNDGFALSGSTLNLELAAPINSSDSGNYAVKLTSSSGNIQFLSGLGSTITYSGSGTSGAAILAQTSGSGSVTITTGDAVTNLQGNGIQAQTVNGAASITANANVNAAAANGTALLAQTSGTGNASVAFGGLGNSVSIGTAVNDIAAISTGGTATIVVGASQPNVLILQPSINLSAAGSFATGLYAQSNQSPASPATTVSVATNSYETINININGANGTAITAINGKGAGAGGVAVNVGLNNYYTVTGSQVAGIYATAAGLSGSGNGAGNVSVTLQGNDSITVNGSGGSLPATGIFASSTGGNVSVSSNDGNIAPSIISISGSNGETTQGIYAQTSGAGAVTIATGTEILSSNGPGIVAQAGSGGISITGSGNVGIGGLGNTAANAAISVATPGPTVIINNGIIGSNTIVAADSFSSSFSVGYPPVTPTYAINASTPSSGPVTIVNNAGLFGLINLTGASTSSLTNNGVWATTGTSTFGGNASTISNPGYIAISGNTTFANLQSLTNTGMIDLGNLNPTPGNQLTVSGAFIGGKGSQLNVNTYLGTTASGSTCGALSDCLQIGSSSGVTSIVINDTAPASAAGANGSGILLVNGASAAGNFVIDPSSPGYDANAGTIDEGLIAYGLNYANNQERLVSGAGATAVPMPQTVTAVQSTVMATAPALTRQADLIDEETVVTSSASAATPASFSAPDTAASPQPAAAQSDSGAETISAATVTPGTWTAGAFNNVTASVPVTSNVAAAPTIVSSYSQQSYGFSAGVDTKFSDVFTRGDAVLLGGFAGWLGSSLSFRSGNVSANLHGTEAGVYATWLDNGLFVDAALMGDFLTMSYTQNGAALLNRSPSFTTWGEQSDLGKHVELGGGAFVEPVASFDYFTTHGGNAGSGAVTAHFGANDNADGGLGVRIGALARGRGNILNVSLTGRMWDEFDSNSRVSLVSGGNAIQLNSSMNGTYGEFVVSAKVLGTDNGWSGFIDGGVRFRNGYTSTTLSGGIQYHW